MGRDLSADLKLGLDLMEQVDQYTLSHFQAADYQVESKVDLSPVTEIDRGAEQMIRSHLQLHRPQDRIYGEEYGQDSFASTAPKDDTSGAQWIIDPIDGTKNFIRGVPVWATLLALEIEGQAQLGIVSAPGLGKRWYAYLGGGAFQEYRDVRGEKVTKALSVSRVSQLEDASFSYSSLSGWKDIARLEQLIQLCLKVWRSRAYGDFWSYMLVAEGVLEAAAEPDLEVYDMAALVPIVQEAGGKFTGLDGRSGYHSGNALASNNLLHSTLLGLLGKK